VFLSIYRAGDGEEILRNIKGLKPSFRSERGYEIIAVTDDGETAVGKYRDSLFVISSKPHSIPAEPLEKFRIEFQDVEMGRNFQFGKYRLENGTLLIETELKTEDLKSAIPPLLSEFAVARILISDANIRAEYLTKEETKIIIKVTEILEGATSLTISRLEELAFSVSSLKGEFFSSYMRYKDELEEISYCLIRAERLSERLGSILSHEIQELKGELEILKYFESSFESTLNGVRDALDTIHLKLGSLHRKEDLELQRKTSSLQAAAAVIEFIAVFYYSLGIWSKYADLSAVPKWMTFFLLTSLSFLVVVYTEIIGEILTERVFKKRFFVTTAMIIAVFLAMLYLTLSH